MIRMHVLVAGLLSLLALSSLSQAETITLERTGPCLSAFYCSNVANDAGDTIPAVIYSANYRRVIVDLGGSADGGFTTWDSGLYAVKSAVSSGPPGYTTTLTNVPLYDGAGNVLIATLQFQGGQVTGPCHQNGRVCIFPHAPVYLVSGTLSSQ